MNLHIGDKLKIVANVSKHGFQIGQVVTVAEIVESTGNPVCVGNNPNQSYCLHDSEFEIVWEV